MAILQELETLFGYERSENLAPKSLLISILGQILPNYKVIGLVAIGAEGAIVKAENQTKSYAVKIAHPRFSRSQEVIKVWGFWRYDKEETNQARVRFIRGAQIQQKIVELIAKSMKDFVRVPGEVSIIENPTLAICMEFVEGISLLRFLMENRNFKASMLIYRQLLVCLQFIHGCGFIHRDIKPENILVCGNSRLNPQLCFVDWAQSKEINPEFSQTLPGTMLGTLPYSSSRMTIDGQAFDANEADDIVAAGVMLWEFCNFRKVPKPENSQELLVNKNARQRYIRDLSRNIHPWLHEVFFKAVEEEKEENRFHHVEPMLFEFEKVLMRNGFFESGAKLNMDFFELRKLVFEQEERIKGLEEVIERIRDCF